MKFIILHHTVSNRDKTTLADVDAWHKVRWNWKSSLGHYMGYHFLITGDGEIYQGARLSEERAHVRGYNNQAIGIALTGNFEIEKPSEAQLKSTENLLEKLTKEHFISKRNVRGHLELSRTLCPGRNFMPWIKRWRTSDLNSLQKQIDILRLMVEQLMIAIKKLKAVKSNK